MKITIYELLGMIKDGKAPKKIKIFNQTFVYTGDKRPQRFYRMLNQENYLLRDFVYTLDKEVEILEEEKKIPEKLDKYVDISGDLACEWSFAEKKLANKINEIIDTLEMLNEKIK